MRKKLLLMLVLSILVASTLVGCSQASSSNPSALTILSITNGNVYVMKAGTSSWIGAQVGTSLEVGDTIKTDDDSSAQITFFDGSIIELYGGTEVKIISLDVSDTGSTTITLEQTIGTTISRVTKLLDPASRYEIETPTGVAAVRGSSMLVEVFPDESIWVINLEGKIWVTYDGVELQVPEGQVCVVRVNELPQFMPFILPEGGDIVTDLAIDKSDSSDPVDPGTSLTYSLQITNNGPSDSTDTVVIDALPSGVSFVSATNGGTYDPGSHAVSWALGTLAKDASTSLNIAVTVNESTPPGIITNVAMVSANESESYPDNNIATEVTTINIVNNPPVAGDDSDTTPEGAPVTIDVLGNDSDIDGDILTVDSVTQGTNGSVINNGSNVTYTPDVGFNGTDSFTYTISDGKGGTDTASVDVTVTVVETFARINAQIDTGPDASIYVRDNTIGDWATDEDTGDPVDGTNHVTSGPSGNIRVAGGHDYCVWVYYVSVGGNVTYEVKNYPDGWSISPAPPGGEAACGYAADTTYGVHFTEITEG
jgi:uncharacterized repeat protein (TIGR01451 family)